MNEKRPPEGVDPYYVHIAWRAKNLCEAIVKQLEGSDPDHNRIRLWCYELIQLNELDRNLRYQEKQKMWAEDRHGRLFEIK